MLEAAHITPYLRPRSNHLQNGLILRSDLHRACDTGYVTVTRDLRLAVSGELREELENGNADYAMDGRRLMVPHRSCEQPSRSAPPRHAQNVFK